MSSDFPDDNLYELLGVDANAPADVIRQAYRRLAMTWHPDRNTAQDAEHTFKRIRFAYDVLSDSSLRIDYDRHVATQPAKQPRPRDAAASATGARAPNLSRRARITLHEQIYGCKVNLKLTRTEYCDHCDGSGHSNAPATTCKTCDGSGEVRSALGLFSFFGPSSKPCDECDGKGKVRSPCAPCKGTGINAKKTGHLKFDVPAGIRPGVNLRVRGHGRRGRSGEAAGDLLVRIDIAEHPLFEPDYPNLRGEMPINVFRVLAGGNIEVPTLDDAISVPINSELFATPELRLAGHGMLDGSSGERGDLLMKLRLFSPSHFSEKQRALLAELEQSTANDPLQKEWKKRLRQAASSARNADESRE